MGVEVGGGGEQGLRWGLPMGEYRSRCWCLVPPPASFGRLAHIRRQPDCACN